MTLAQPTEKQPVPKSRPPKWRRSVLALMVPIFILSLLPFIYEGTFSRYQADDYCFSSSVIQNGFLGSIKDNYTGWSNRFSTVILTGLIDPLKVIGMQILPGALIVGMAVGLYLLLKEVKIKQGWKLGWIEITILAVMVTFFTVYAAPDQFQSFFWRAGSITYTLPVVLLPFLLTYILRSEQYKLGTVSFFLSGVAIFIFALFNGGFSETTAAFQAALFVLLLIHAYLRSPKEYRTQRVLLLLFALAGIAAAMIIMILSPGNAVRLQNMPETPGFFRLIYLSFRFAAGFLVNTLETVPLPVIVSFIFGFVLALLADWKEIQLRSWRWLFWGIPVAAFLLVVSVCAPSAYGESAYAEARAFLPARWILNIAGITWFYLLGIVYQNWRYRNSRFQVEKMHTNVALVILILCIYPWRGGMLALGSIPEAQARAQAWDTRAAIIEQEKASGNQNPVVQALDSYGRIRELSNDPKLWVNKCAAVYYGVQTITAK